MPIDRRDDDERTARAAALLKQLKDIRARADAAQRHAREIVTKAMRAREEHRRQRETLLKRAKEALRIARASSPGLLRFPIRQGKRFSMRQGKKKVG